MRPSKAMDRTSPLDTAISMRTITWVKCWSSPALKHISITLHPRNHPPIPTPQLHANPIIPLALPEFSPTCQPLLQQLLQGIQFRLCSASPFSSSTQPLPQLTKVSPR